MLSIIQLALIFIFFGLVLYEKLRTKPTHTIYNFWAKRGKEWTHVVLKEENGDILNFENGVRI